MRDQPLATDFFAELVAVDLVGHALEQHRHRDELAGVGHLVGLRPAARALAGERLVLDVAELQRALEGLVVHGRAAGAEDADGGGAAHPDAGGAELDELAAVTGGDLDPQRRGLRLGVVAVGAAVLVAERDAAEAGDLDRLGDVAQHLEDLLGDLLGAGEDGVGDLVERREELLELGRQALHHRVVEQARGRCWRR